jgi:hypothetical protein
VSFRTHWYCDPVCDGHFHGRLSPQMRCGGKRHIADAYHKADYHNLCVVFGRRHIELPLQRIEGFRNRNPIYVDRVYVDLQVLAECFERAAGVRLSDCRRCRRARPGS